MRKIVPLRFAAIVSLLLLVPLCLAAGDKKKKPPEQFCSVSFTILKDSNGKPIKNASVVLHSLTRDGSQEKDGFQLKTDTDGKASMDDLPYGLMRVQVVAHGLQTYGEDIDLNQPRQELVIRLKAPAEQISIY